MSKTTKLFFTLSVLLNLSLVGIVGGHALRQAQEGDWGSFASEDLSPETRQIMRQVYKDKYQEIWDMRADLRRKKGDLKDVIFAEEFDVKAFKKAASEIKKQNDRAFESRIDSFTKVLQKLPKAEREKLAQRTIDILVGHRKWDRTKNGPRPEDKGVNPFSPEEEKKEKEHEREKGKGKNKDKDDKKGHEKGGD